MNSRGRRKGNGKRKEGRNHIQAAWLSRVASIDWPRRSICSSSLIGSNRWTSSRRRSCNGTSCFSIGCGGDGGACVVAGGGKPEEGGCAVGVYSGGATPWIWGSVRVTNHQPSARRHNKQINGTSVRAAAIRTVENLHEELKYSVLAVDGVYAALQRLRLA